MIAITNLRIFARRIVSATKKRVSGILSALLFIPFATSSSSIGSTIFTGIWSVILGLFKSISVGLGGMFNQMMSGFGQSVVLMFQSFGFSMQGYGVWAPVMFTTGLSLAVVVGYLFFAFADGERDLIGTENLV